MFRDSPYHLREVFLRADEGQISAALHAVLRRFPELMLGSYPYFDNRPYTLKLTLESKDADYVASAHTVLLAELERLALFPLEVQTTDQNSAR
jgi:hypothetical protein